MTDQPDPTGMQDHPDKMVLLDRATLADPVLQASRGQQVTLVQWGLQVEVACAQGIVLLLQNGSIIIGVSLIKKQLML